MALTVTVTNRENMGSRAMTHGTIDFDSSYPTNGEVLLANTLKMASVDMIIVTSKNGYVFEYDYANEKVKAYYADYDAVADGALIEVANEVDLASLTGVRFMVFGTF